ncbi:homeobox protein Hox-D8 isoform X4 [Drosophila tropicalis]|uniref:homeobox protein Hox-D8 isoform X4 n=1 Tax=Drosophila tropicalis TaxID=46794 RepID=UPI0035AB7A17
MEMNKTAAQPKQRRPTRTLKNDKVAADLGPEQPQTSEPTPTLKPSSQEENISSAVRSAWEKNFDVFGPIVQKNGFTRNLKADRIICGFPRNRQLVFLVQFGEIEEVVTQPDMKKYAPQLLIDFYIANLHDGPLENCKAITEGPMVKPVGRKHHSQYQISEMQLEFQSNSYLTPEKCQHLAAKLQLTERQLKSWFSNRRTKIRKLSILQEGPQ